jgi:exoribonuclease R
MTEVKTEKKPRVPRNFDTILAGAKSLTLKERVDLRNALTVTIDEEVKALRGAADEAAKLVG